jgi:hypothetical protein
MKQSYNKIVEAENFNSSPRNLENESIAGDEKITKSGVRSGHNDLLTPRKLTSRTWITADNCRNTIHFHGTECQ